MADGTIIVTGSTRGIGAAIAIELVAQGFKVAGLTRSGRSFIPLIAAIRKWGLRHLRGDEARAA